MAEKAYEDLGSFDLDAARSNMSALKENEYPGRFVAAGINRAGTQLHIVAARMGRNPSSKTATYKINGDNVDNIPFGEKVDPLTEYRTMTRIDGGWHFVSNGVQTEAMFEAVLAETATGLRANALDASRAALLEQHHEPDPSHTPRISLVAGAGLLLKRVPALFSVIRNDPEDPSNKEATVRRFYRGHLGAVLEAGLGLSITTYERNEDPLQPFEGGPRPVQIANTARGTAQMFAETLDATGGFFVSVAARAVDLRTGRIEATAVLNKYGETANYPNSGATYSDFFSPADLGA